MKKIKFIDLFAGLGGTRIGFEQACAELGFDHECVLTSEIKPHAIEALELNFIDENLVGDITKIEMYDIPKFDYLLGGFPCQPFSSAGSRKGFHDTRGTLFFNIENILKHHSPKGFILENVEGLSTHDNGKTLQVIMDNLNNLGYKTTYQIIDSSDHGLPQARVRTYIVGRKRSLVDLDLELDPPVMLKSILQKKQPLINDDFTKKLLANFSPSELNGKSIKDKRGGPDNIHSWDFSLKGATTKKQRILLGRLFKERRKKHWAEEKKIDWMDGMSLTTEEIFSFSDDLYPTKDELDASLAKLTSQGYLKKECPKKLSVGKDGLKFREYDLSQPQGYNIVTGKLSFPLNKIMNREGIAPTLVATDADRLAVVDGAGIRKLTRREGLRLFGFPEDYSLDHLNHRDAFDLLGNSIAIPVVKKVALRLMS